MWDSSKILGLNGSIVLTVIVHKKKTERQAKYKQTIWYIYVKSGYPGYDWDFCFASTGVNWHMVRILHYLSNNI